MSIFEEVKWSVATRQAAEHFGIRAGRNGMCRYSFHSTRTEGYGAVNRKLLPIFQQK